MTLVEFIETKPKELRLGQHFYNQYFYKLSVTTNLHRTTQELYYTPNPIIAVGIIHQIMEDYQWEDLP